MIKPRSNDYDEISACMGRAVEGFAQCAPELARISDNIRKAFEDLGSPSIQQYLARHFAATPTPED